MFCPKVLVRSLPLGLAMLLGQSSTSNAQGLTVEFIWEFNHEAEDCREKNTQAIQSALGEKKVPFVLENVLFVPGYPELSEESEGFQGNMNLFNWFGIHPYDAMGNILGVEDLKAYVAAVYAIFAQELMRWIKDGDRTAAPSVMCKAIAASLSMDPFVRGEMERNPSWKGSLDDDEDVEMPLLGMFERISECKFNSSDLEFMNWFSSEYVPSYFSWLSKQSPNYQMNATDRSWIDAEIKKDGFDENDKEFEELRKRYLYSIVIRDRFIRFNLLSTIDSILQVRSSPFVLRVHYGAAHLDGIEETLANHDKRIAVTRSACGFASLVGTTQKDNHYVIQVNVTSEERKHGIGMPHRMLLLDSSKNEVRIDQPSRVDPSSQAYYFSVPSGKIQSNGSYEVYVEDSNGHRLLFDSSLKVGK